MGSPNATGKSITSLTHVLQWVHAYQKAHFASGDDRSNRKTQAKLSGTPWRAPSPEIAILKGVDSKSQIRVAFLQYMVNCFGASRDYLIPIACPDRSRPYGLHRKGHQAEPVLVLRAESESEERFEEMASQIRTAVDISLSILAFQVVSRTYEAVFVEELMIGGRLQRRLLRRQGNGL